MPLTMSTPAGVEESIHGIAVRDPYRWLEEGDSPETRDWVEDQQSQCDQYFAQSDDVDLLRDRVREYLDVETVDQPARIGTRYFYRRRDKGREQGCIYIRDTSTGKERLLIDPSGRGNLASVGIHRISPNGSLLAYELKQGGADTSAIHIVDVESGVELADTLEPGYARGFTFATDQTGFYYCHESVRSLDDHTIRFHRLGGHASDEVVYRCPRSPDSRLILTSDEVHLGAVFVHRHDGEPFTNLLLAQRESPTNWKEILSDLPVTFKPFLNNGRILALSFRETPKGVLLELADDGSESRLIIPEQSQAIQQLVVVGDRVAITHLNDWGMIVVSWTMSGQRVGRLDLPGDGTIRLVRAQDSDALFCTYESFSAPPATFEFTTDFEMVRLWHQQSDPSFERRCQTRPVTVDSTDGTRIPLMLVRQKATPPGIEAPLILTAYGGFGSFVTPQYSVLVSILLEFDSIFALARIRGGGEFGCAWHEAGKRRRRQNAFDDFIAAAEWVCADGITSPKRLGIIGGSNGGLLVGAVLTQRPELFGAAVCIAPLLDMVRYEKFDLASRWRHEYGSADNGEDFRALYAYSPYHHVDEDIDYPPILFISGDSDDRCNPAHVRKMATRLQRRHAQSRPILVEYSHYRGHSPVLPLSVRVESLAQRIAFLCRELGLHRIGVHNDPPHLRKLGLSFALRLCLTVPRSPAGTRNRPKSTCPSGHWKIALPGRETMSRRGFGLCLLFQTSSVSTAFRSSDCSAAPIRVGSGNGHRRPGSAIQISRLG